MTKAEKACWHLDWQILLFSWNIATLTVKRAHIVYCVSIFLALVKKTIRIHLDYVRFCFLSLPEQLGFHYIFYLRHCHTILPSNWLLGNMALWMGCIFTSVCSGLKTLRVEKHPCCSLVSSVCTVATKTWLTMGLKNDHCFTHFIKYALHNPDRIIYIKD